MKKFLKLCLAVAALATMFGFASCSNGSSDDPTTTGGGATAKEVTVLTKTITISNDVFTYKTVDGEVDTSDENVTVDADGNITIKAAAGENTLTISADGTKLTYKAGTKTYEATVSEDDDSENSEPISFENKDDPTDKVEATTEEDTTKETVVTVTELKYTDSELAGKKFSYTSDGETKYLLFYNGLCYQGEDTNAITTTKTTIVKDNGKLYKAAKYTRKSGTGLYTTFDDSDGGSMSFNENGTGTVTFGSGSASFTFTNASGVLTLIASGQPNTTFYYDGTHIYMLARELTFVENYPPAATTNSIVGSKYYNYGIDNNNGKIKIKVSTFTIDSTSAGTHKSLSTIIKNGAVTENNASGNTTFTYSVSGSTINITEDGKTMALAVGADNSLTDEMNHNFTKFDGEIYGLTAATDADNYSCTVLLLAKDGTGKFIVKRMKDGLEKGSTNDLTNITVNGTTMSCTSGEHTVTATFSDDKSTVTVNDGKNNPVLTKL